MMATVTHIEKRFPAVEGSLLSTVEARVKVLRAAGGVVHGLVQATSVV